jgi:hypothetical protein
MLADLYNRALKTFIKLTAIGLSLGASDLTAELC